MAVTERNQLVNEVLDFYTKTIAQEVDFSIVSSILIENKNWVKITLTPMSGEKSESIDRWLTTECQGRHMEMGLVFVFERKEDAVMFALRWA